MGAQPPAYWLVEMSGLPFGLAGDMMGVGNPWRGMAHGSVVRAQTARRSEGLRCGSTATHDSPCAERARRWAKEHSAWSHQYGRRAAAPPCPGGMRGAPRRADGGAADAWLTA